MPKAYRPSKITIIGEVIHFRGVPVATITAPSGTMRTEFEQELLDYGSDEWDALHDEKEKAYAEGWEDAEAHFAAEAAE